MNATTQDLIPVFAGQIGGVSMNVCDGRTLHAFLENGDKFADWIKDRINRYGFVENQDFAIASGNSEAKRGGHNRKDYILALDTAKELAMVENNDKGRMARRYFIECERKLHERKPPYGLRALPRDIHVPLIHADIQRIRDRANDIARYIRYHKHGAVAAAIYRPIFQRLGVSRIDQISYTDLHLVENILGRMMIDAHAAYLLAYEREEAVLNALHACAGLPIPPAHPGQFDLLEDAA